MSPESLNQQDEEHGLREHTDGDAGDVDYGLNESFAGSESDAYNTVMGDLA